MDVYTRRLRGRASCGRATRSRISGTCSSRSASRGRRRPRYPIEMPPDPSAAARDRRAADGRRASAPDDRLVIVHVSAGNPFPTLAAGPFRGGIAATREADPRTRVSRSSPGHGESTARLVVDDGARSTAGVGPCGRSRRAASSTLDRASRAGRSRGALHRRRQRSAAHRRHHDACRSSRLYGPTLPGDRRRGGRMGPSRFRFEVHGLPCRPCDQRVCEPGDFRCLTHNRRRSRCSRRPSGR